MPITVTFELGPVAESDNGKPIRVSPSNFAIDKEKAAKYYMVNYDYDSRPSNKFNDNKITSAYVRGMIEDYKVADSGQQITIPVDSRFRNDMPAYLEFIAGKKPELLTKQQLTDSLKLADWLDDTSYTDYVVQLIFDSWTNVMMIAVYFEFYLQLQQLVFIRAPYLLLPPNWTKDKVFIKTWFDTNRHKTILVDRMFFHQVNIPINSNLWGKDIQLLSNYFIYAADSGDVTSLMSPLLNFYDNEHHRLFVSTFTILTGGKMVTVGEYSTFADTDENNLIHRVYYNNKGQKTGIWSPIISTNGREESLYENGLRFNPVRCYYASGNFHGYHIWGQVSPDGVYPSYNDDTDNTLSSEMTFKGGKELLFKRYQDQTLSEVYYFDEHGVQGRVVTVDTYYPDGGNLRSHIDVEGNDVVDTDLTLDNILNNFRVYITSYYSNNQHQQLQLQHEQHRQQNKESTGRLVNGVKVGTWYHYNNDQDNTVREVVNY